jgi:hypothetical protein
MLSPFNAFPTDAISVEMWLRSSDTTTAGTPFSYAAGAQFNAFTLYDVRALQLFVAGQTVATTVDVADGMWHQLVVTWESASGTATLYVDATAAFSATIAAGAPLMAGGAAVLGQEQDALGGAFDATQRFIGEIDEVAIFARVLTPAEIAEHRRTMACLP